VLVGHDRGAAIVQATSLLRLSFAAGAVPVVLAYPDRVDVPRTLNLVEG
jgi:hypothetical protein